MVIWFALRKLWALCSGAQVLRFLGGGVELTDILNGRSGKRDVAYAACGMLLGVMAPIGWIILRLLLFWDDSQSLAGQVMQDIMGTEQSRYMYTYMCGGTMMVLGLFGFFIGRASQQIHDRALKLDILNREVAEQKASFEQRFPSVGSHCLMGLYAGEGVPPR